jgi:hypothetical protein
MLCVAMGLIFLMVLIPLGKILRIHEIQEILVKPFSKIRAAGMNQG